jgi:hypothetical protein
MLLGMSLATFTVFHVILSLVGLAAGLIVLHGLCRGRLMPRSTAVFLATTLATTITGFMFPFNGFTPAIAVGLVSLALLAIALAAIYVFRLNGRWRPVFVITSVAALYLNAFVAVVQAFQKLSVLKPLAPTGTELPFVVAQALTLLAFVAAGIVAALRFKPSAMSDAMEPRAAGI